MGGEYLNTRDALIDLIRYTRVLAKRADSPLEESEDTLEDQLRDPFRFVVIGEDGVGKTSFLEALTGASLEGIEFTSPSVSVVRDLGHRVFEEAEDACKKVYTTQLSGLEFVETRGLSSIGEEQVASLRYLIEGADFIFWLFSSENPWAATTWDALERDYSLAAMKSALVLHQSDRRSSSDVEMLLGHMKELCVKRVNIAMPLFATNNVQENVGMQECTDYVNLTLNRSIDRRRQLRYVYKQTYAILCRTEENVDDRSRNLAGDQEYLQSIEAQIDRTREEEVRRVMENMSQLGQLLRSQIKRVVRFSSFRTGVIASHCSFFGKGRVAAKVERYLIDCVSKESEYFAEKEVQKMRTLCREKWLEIKPHLESRLSIDVGDFNEKSFSEQQEVFVEEMSRSVRQAMLSLKQKRFLDALIARRYQVIRNLLQWALLLITIGSLVGVFTVNPLNSFSLSIVGAGGGVLLASAFYARKTSVRVNRSFGESLEDAVPALQKNLREGYIDRVRAYFNGYMPMFESMRRHVSDAKSELEPLQKVAAQLFLRLKSLEQEI